MTDEKIALRTLLEKGSDATFLREMIGFAAERLMQLETDTLCGAGHGERNAERRNVMATATVIGRPARVRSSCAFPSCGAAATSRPSSNLVAWPKRR